MENTETQNQINLPVIQRLDRLELLVLADSSFFLMEITLLLVESSLFNILSEILFVQYIVKVFMVDLELGKSVLNTPVHADKRPN